ncbi:MAG: TlpA disulfide reductase family protein [Bacteroidia bacterium]
MKNALLILFLCPTLLLPAQKNLHLQGKITQPKGQAVQVYYTKGMIGWERTSFKATLAADGSFALDVALDQPRLLYFSHGREYTNFYAQPGDSLTICLDAQVFDESVRYTGQGAAESNFLAAWFLRYESEAQQEMRNRQRREASPEDYLRYRQTLHDEQLQQFMTDAEATSLRADFVQHMRYNIEYSYLGDVLNFPNYYAYVHQLETHEVVLPEGYYGFLDKAELNQPRALLIDEYRDFLGSYMYYRVSDDQLGEEKASLAYALRYDAAAEHFEGAVLNVARAQVLLEACLYGDVNTIKGRYEDFSREVFDEDLIAYLLPRYEKALSLARGRVAPDFTVTDDKGNEVSLSDFRGKVVYIDFWASWCGPCRREMPASRELKAHFKDEENVVFLYVSVDDSEAAWRQAMEEEQLDGVHVWTGGWKGHVTESYGIEGIPSYFLIYADGTIADPHAPRPSHEGITAAIEAAIHQEAPARSGADK